MSDVSIDNGDELSSGSLSRRTALKAGVAAGVGVAAWSGATITSLGGTPAYAAGCTFVITVDLNSGCRNTDQGCSPFAYHELKSNIIGFVVNNSPAEHTCCNAVSPNPTFTWTDTTLQCSVTLLFGNAPGKCSGAIYNKTIGPESDGSIEIPLSCFPGVTTNTFYSVVAHCVSKDAPPGCIS